MDNVFVNLVLAIQFQIEEENTEKAFFALNNPIHQIDAYISDAVRTVIPRMSLDKLFESQHVICQHVADNLSSTMKDFGYTIKNTLIIDIDPDADVKAAMNKINASERLKQAAQHEADASYISEIRKAEANRDAKKLHGEGIALMRKAVIDGYKVSVEDMSDATGLSSTSVIDFITNIQHLDTLAAIGKTQNTKTLFLTHNIKDNKVLQALESRE